MDQEPKKDEIFNDENLVNKVLFDISDVYYFPFILNFLELNNVKTIFLK